MKRLSFALLTAGMIAGLGPAAPASAEQTLLSRILFGKIYHDDVTAIQIWGQSQYAQPLPLSVKHPMRSTIRAAQAKVNGDPNLMRAIEDRGIALHNVIEVVTALNGGHVVYYR